MPTDEHDYEEGYLVSEIEPEEEDPKPEVENDYFKEQEERIGRQPPEEQRVSNLAPPTKSPDLGS
jgi:hypothetical protein